VHINWQCQRAKAKIPPKKRKDPRKRARKRGGRWGLFARGGDQRRGEGEGIVRTEAGTRKERGRGDYSSEAGIREEAKARGLPGLRREREKRGGRANYNAERK
jgi:hypothetical protein